MVVFWFHGGIFMVGIEIFRRVNTRIFKQDWLLAISPF